MTTPTPNDSSSLDTSKRGSRGWTRGATIALVAGFTLSAATAIAMASDPSIKPTKPPAPACTIKTSDIINKNIDIGAQYSLMRKLSGDRFSQIEASSMFMAIKEKRLDGILLPPRKAVSDRGARMSPPRGYWDLIPKGASSTCLHKPVGESPMIVYREKMSDGQIDEALTAAWSDCGILNLPEPCEYVVDLHKPQVECKTDKDCKGDLQKCNTDTNTCGVQFPDDHILGATCPHPFCDPHSKVNFCGYQLNCLERPGEVCGVCENASGKSVQCHEANAKRHRLENKKCRDSHTPQKTFKYGIECAVAAAKCETGSAPDCLKFAECFVAPEPYKEYKKCLNNESARYHNESKRCTRL